MVRVTVGVGDLEVIAKAIEEFVKGHRWVLTDPACHVLAETSGETAA